MLNIGTRLKIKIAKILLYIVKIFHKNNIKTISRQGINFEIDIEEGIDLHLYIFGGFQKHIYSNSLISLKKDAVIFDVGANSGVMSLIFSKLSPEGKIYSFEPTDYALKRFNKNLSLNEELSSRIIINQCFIHSTCSDEADLTAFSSWKLTGNEKRHHIHKGIVKPTENVPSITIDHFVESNSIQRIDFIKIDTDGYELEVLKGAINSIKKLQPQIIFEIGLYVMQENNISFKNYYELFSSIDYKIFTVKGKNVNLENFTKRIPSNGTVDLIAIPG